jgi:hypothetical protein
MDSVRTLALADLGSATLDRLIREGEGLFVERKEIEPAEGFGPTASSFESDGFAWSQSFANTLGGWLLLGVKDEGRRVVGFECPGRADLQDWMREKLTDAVDPVPPFTARLVDHPDGAVGVVRVLESFDTPHIVRGTGALWVRVSGGKKRPGGRQPVDDHRTLIELSRRGDTARERARNRLVALPTVAFVIPPTAPAACVGWVDHEDDCIVMLTLRVSPFSVPGHLGDRALSQPFAQHLHVAALELLRRAAPPLPPGAAHAVRFQVLPRAIAFSG